MATYKIKSVIIDENDNEIANVTTEIDSVTDWTIEVDYIQEPSPRLEHVGVRPRDRH